MTKDATLPQETKFTRRFLLAFSSRECDFQAVIKHSLSIGGKGHSPALSL